jgi:hypothetical protein
VRAAELINQQHQHAFLAPDNEVSASSATDQLFAHEWQDPQTIDLDTVDTAAPNMVRTPLPAPNSVTETSELEIIRSSEPAQADRAKSGLGALLAEANHAAQSVRTNAAAEPVAGASNSESAQPPQPVADAAPAASSSAIPRSRTEALPMVTIDIDRLLQATFTPTQFGKLALTNPALDQHRRHTLLDVEAGKSLGAVIDEGTRPAAAILSSFRYCLDRGYIDSADSVVPLTADLLLGRMEIDQYLLQRRRLTGDQLRDLVEIARNEAVKLSQVLVRCGYLTSGDLETLEREQKRFAFK